MYIIFIMCVIVILEVFSVFDFDLKFLFCINCIYISCIILFFSYFFKDILKLKLVKFYRFICKIIFYFI